MRFAIAVGLVLSAPLLAMQFTNEVQWTLFDFIVAGGLLYGASLVYVLTTRNVNTASKRIAIGGAVVLVLALVWAELAVGIVGTPLAGS